MDSSSPHPDPHQHASSSSRDTTETTAVIASPGPSSSAAPATRVKKSSSVSQALPMPTARKQRGKTSRTPGSSSCHLKPPSKQKKSETTATSSAKSFSGRAAEGERSSSDSGKKKKSATAASRQFKAVPLPARTTSASCGLNTISSATAAGSSSCTKVVTPNMFYRGVPVEVKAFASDRSYKQPKTELFEYQEKINLQHLQSATATTTTTTATRAAAEPEGDTGVVSHYPSSHQGEGMQDSFDSTSHAVGDDDSFIDPIDDFLSPFIYNPEFFLEDYTFTQLDCSPSHSTHDSSPLLFTPESSPPMACPSKSSEVHLQSGNSAAVAIATTVPVTSSAIPGMSTKRKHGLVQGQMESTTAECTGQGQRAAEEPASQHEHEQHTSSSSASRRSKVWQYFVSTDNGRKAKCNLCSKVVSRGQVIGHLTNSGMNQHMRSHHHAVLLSAEKGFAPPRTTTTSTITPTSATHTTTTSAAAGSELKQRSSVQTTMPEFGGFQSRGMSRQQTRKITRLIGEFIAVGGATFNLVDGESFKRLINALSPNYQVPSRTTFSRSVVPALYRSCVVLLKEELGKAAGQSVHFTTDLWSAPSGQHAFLSLTGHWWQPNVPQDTSSGARKTSSARPRAAVAEQKAGLHAFLLHAEVMDQKHTADNILHALQNMMAQWLGEQSGTQAQMGFVVTDGGANMIKALRLGRFVGVRCTAHILHLVVKAAIDDITGDGELWKVVESCRKIAGHFHKSVRDSHLLRLEQRNAGLPEHRLKQDVATRWNSTLDMLERILQQQKPIHAMARKDPIGIDKPLGRDDWAMIEQTVAVLRPFRTVTEILSKESASLAQVVPLFAQLTSNMDGFICNRDRLPGGIIHAEVAALLRRLKEQLARRIKEHIDPCPEFMLATICDPRFKGKMALHNNSLMTWKEKLIQRIRERERKISTNQEEDTQETEESGDDDDDNTTFKTAAQTRVTESDAFWAATFNNFVGLTTSTKRKQPRKETAADFVKAYLAEAPLPPDTDPCQYWDDKRSVWPAFSQVAQELLSCPPTTVQSERVFSITGNIMCPQRSQLAPQLLEQMTFLKVNLPKLGYPALAFD